MSIRGAFWRFAHKRYQRRKPSKRFEVLMFGWGAFWFLIYAISFFSDWVRVSNVAGALVFAGLPLLIGALHRRIRLERASGPDALYRKRLAANG